MNYFIGVDVGTSATKSVLFDENGSVIASDSQSYEFTSLMGLMTVEDDT